MNENLRKLFRRCALNEGKNLPDSILKTSNFKFPYFVVYKNTKIEVFKCLLFLFLTQKVKSHAPPFILTPKTADCKLVDTCIHLWWDETVVYLFKNVQMELIRTHKWFKDLRSWPYKARTDTIACKCDVFYKEVYLTVVTYFAGWTTGCVGWRRLGSTAPTCCCMWRAAYCWHGWR